MQKVAAILKMKGHGFKGYGGRTIFGPFDIEGHLGTVCY